MELSVAGSYLQLTPCYKSVITVVLKWKLCTGIFLSTLLSYFVTGCRPGCPVAFKGLVGAASATRFEQKQELETNINNNKIVIT